METPKNVLSVREKVRQMIRIVNELEEEFPGRHFTLDGHLVGSIGEVVAAYYYGIDLYPASTKIHDGEIGSKKVQIKTTQRDNVLIKYEPEYLIVLYLASDGEVFEIYNGSGNLAFQIAGKPDSSGNRRLSVRRLLELDKQILDSDRILAVHEIEKYHLQSVEDGRHEQGYTGRYYDAVYEAVRMIPTGKVATYGQIASMVGSPGASQSVGNALHANPNPATIPCHRVVDANGRLAKGFAFGGLEGQRKRLEDEGVTVIDGKVDLSIYQYNNI